MFAWIIGDGGGVQSLIANELRHHRYSVLISSDRESLPDVNIDLCLDASATGLGDVKKMFSMLDGQATHYVLLSSCLVYPAVPRRTPWRENDVDLNDATGFNTLWASRRRLRAAERELRYTGRRRNPWTILRPSVVENLCQPDPNSIWWMVSRILDGGPIVLPDGDDPLFAHVTDSDLANAVRIVAGNERAHFQTLNVTSPGLMSYDSLARRVMATLDQEVPIVRVPGKLWSKLGLRLPYERYLHSSFIAESPLLTELGWEASDETVWLREHLKSLVDNPPVKPHQRRAELDLAKAWRTSNIDGSVWCLTAQAGAPMSLELEKARKPEDEPEPLLRVLYHSPGLAEEMFLTSPTRSNTRLVFGHNALLEMVSPGVSSLKPGELFLPVARRPCGTDGCPACEKTEPGVSGITDDGYGIEYVSVTERHLVPLSNDMGALALLADPLACLLSVVPPFLDHMDGPVWVFGERIEALLALLVIERTGRPVLHVGRNEVRPQDLPKGVQGKTIARVRTEIRDNTIKKAGMFINCSGARDGENILNRGLSQGGIRITPFDATMPHKRRIDVRYPLAAPGRRWLEMALQQLATWKGVHDLERYISPVPLRQASDAFAAGPFQMRYLDATGEAR